MNNKLLSCLIAAALGTSVALAPPALARGGGGGGGGGHGGGGGMHAGGMGGGGHFGGFGGGHFAGGSFGHGGFGHGGFSPRFSRFAFHDRFHHRFHRFGFFGAPYDYGYYDGCWRQAWTSYGPQWINACGDYAYGY
jgi:hypothetical protein